MIITKARRDELKPKKKAVVAPAPMFVGPMLPGKTVIDNTEVLNKLEEISSKVSREPRSIAIPEKPVIKEGNDSLAKLMNANTDRIIQAITEKKPSPMEMIPERRGGIIQRVIFKPI